MLKVIHNNPLHPAGGVMIEKHADVKTLKQAKSILRQWADEGETFYILDKQDGITPILIYTQEGELTDIFGQLFD